MKMLRDLLAKTGAFLVIGALIVSVFFVKLKPQVELLPEPVLAARDFFYGLATPDDQTIWMAGSRGKIVRSDDAGKSWVVQPSGVSGSIQAIVAFDAQNAVAVGDLMTLLYTTDGGKTWAKSSVDDGGQVQKGDPHKLLKARIDPKGRVWAVGELSTVLVSEDRGKSFRVVMTYEDVARNDVAFVDGSVGWMVSEFGDVLRTTDGGAVWTKIDPAPVDRSIIATQFCGGQMGVAVGLQGLVLVTRDAGVTWQPIAPVTDEHLFDVVCTEAEFLASGDKGLFVTGTLGDQPSAQATNFGKSNNFWHTALVRRGGTVFASGASAGFWRDGQWHSFIN